MGLFDRLRRPSSEPSVTDPAPVPGIPPDAGDAPPTIDALIERLLAGTHETYPVATDADLEVTEEAIARPLPSSYRVFVSRFSNGAYLSNTQEVSAVGSGNRQVPPIQSEMLDLDPDAQMPTTDGATVRAGDLVPCSLDSNGNCWCFPTGGSTTAGEHPVAYFDPDLVRLFGQLDGFPAWLRILLDHEDEGFVWSATTTRSTKSSGSADSTAVGYSSEVAPVIRRWRGVASEA